MIPAVFYRLRQRIRNARFQVRWGWQRARRGYSDCDWWNLDSFVAGVIADGCKKLREEGISVPMGENDEGLDVEEWHAILSTIEDSFRIVNRIHEYDYEGVAEYEKLQAEFRVGGELFLKWFNSLWN